MPVQTTYLKDYNLLIEFATGEIYIEDVRSYHEEIRKTTYFNDLKSVFTIVHGVNINFGIESLPEYMSIVKKTLSMHKVSWVGMLTSVESTVMGILMKQDSFILRVLNICSSLEKASDYLQIPVSVLEAEINRFQLGKELKSSI